jgi:predicted RNA methylase
VTWRGILLDGHNRHEICQRHGIEFRTTAIDLPDRDAAKIWIVCNQFGRRNLTLFARAELALKLEPLISARAKQKQRAGGAWKVPQDFGEPVETLREIAKVAKISHETLRKVKALAVKGSVSQIEQLRAGEESIDSAFRNLRMRERTEARLQRLQGTAPRDGDERFRLIVADVQRLSAHISAGSVDAIITDPPYGGAYAHLYAPLADFAAHALRDGGSLVVLTGQAHLPQAIAVLSSRLQYQWTLALLLPTAFTLIWGRRISSRWKPVLWLTKGKYVGEFNHDIVRADGPVAADKSFHQWGQNESAMAKLVERFSYRGDLICDPLCGGGVVPLVAVRLGRRCIAADSDPNAIEQTAARLRCLCSDDAGQGEFTASAKGTLLARRRN